MDIKDAATAAGFILTIGGAGVGYGRMAARIDALEAQVVVVQRDVDAIEHDETLAGLIRGLKCYVAKLHNQTLPDCQ